MRRYYLYAFLNGMQFTWTTWLAYVLARGGNPGWAEAAYHLAILLGEVPTGVVADLMGRRTSMLFGLALSAVGALGYFWIDDTVTACLVLGFSGLAGTFLSGADSALLYETALQQGGQEFARKAMARSASVGMAALAVAPAIAGLLYQWQDWAPFVGKSVISLITLAVVWGLKEPTGAAERPARLTLWRQTAEAVRVVRTSPAALTLLLFGWLYNTAAAMAGQFGQAYFPSVGLAMGFTGLVFALGQGASAGGSALAERVGGPAAARWLRSGPLVVALGYVAMGLAAGGLLPAVAIAGAACFVLASGADGIIYPMWQARLNDAIPSAQRATILSFSSAGFSLCMAISFPAASYLPIPAIYLVTGGVAAALAVIWMLRDRPY